MKKFISVLLCAMMIFSLVIVPVSAAEDSLSVLVVNDLHLDYKDSVAAKVTKRNSLSDVYFHASSGGQLPYESVAIIKAFLRDAAASDSEIILMPGDLTSAGNKEDHNAFVALMTEFQESTGKRIYVIPGNHDLFDTTVNEFEALYSGLGYSSAIADDPDTASYVAELNSEYRLLAIDSTTPGESVHGVDAKLTAWVEAQCKKAASDGKKLIAMAHHNLVEHFTLSASVHKGSVINDGSNSLADVLADNNVRFIFTGHTHDQDVKQYKSADGNTIYDIITTSLNAYPLAYREVTFGKTVEIRTKSVTEVDTTLFPAGMHEDALKEAEENFLSYAKNCTYIGIKEVIGSYLKAESLKKVFTTDDEQIIAILHPAVDTMCEIIAYPLYIKDETVEGQSIEALAGKMGTKLPATEYETFLDLIVEIYQAHAEGDEAYAGYSDEMILLQRSLAVILNQALSGLSANEYTLVITFLANSFGANLSDKIASFAGSTLERFKGSEMFVTAVLLPVLTQFSMDEAPADNNVTLPGYESAQTENEDFFAKIRSFFKKIFDFFHTIFALIA